MGLFGALLGGQASSLGGGQGGALGALGGPSGAISGSVLSGMVGALAKQMLSRR
jgi:hypothetical protein